LSIIPSADRIVSVKNDCMLYKCPGQNTCSLLGAIACIVGKVRFI
jgi:hypothetical protein